MRIERIVPNLTVDDLPRAIEEHSRALGLHPVMDHGWIVTLADHLGGHQLSVMTADLTASVNPAVSIFVDDLMEAYRHVESCGLEVVHPITDEPWGVTRFFYRDAAGNVINVGAHTAVCEDL